MLAPKTLHTDSIGIACEHVLKHNMEKYNVIHFLSGVTKPVKQEVAFCLKLVSFSKNVL